MLAIYAQAFMYYMFHTPTNIHNQQGNKGNG